MVPMAVSSQSTVAVDVPAITPDPELMEAKEQILKQIPKLALEGERPPNIVLLFADDLGYADIGPYGSETIPTPHLDRLAGEGVRFSAAYVTAGTCSPSRSGLLSGRYQQRFGFEFNTSGAAITHRLSRGLRPDVITMADVLQRAGYRTGMFGKWHLGTRSYFRPQARRFDEFYGFLAGAHSYFESKRRQPVYSSMMRGQQRLEEKAYLTDAIAREAVAFIRKNRDRPFFAYLPFNAVHTPLEASQEYLDQFLGVENEARRAYYAMTSALDDAVGRILQVIDDEHLAQNTLVFFLNDNGGPVYTRVQDNGKLRLGKLFLFEGGIRVPMMVRWPGRMSAGSTYEGTVSSLDLFPTICAAAGLRVPDSISLDGVDLLPFLRGEKTGDPHERLFWRNGPNKAVRWNEWKLIQSHESRWLFNLKEDPGESENLSDRRPEVGSRLEKALLEWQMSMKPPRWSSKPNRRKVLVDGQVYEINI